MDTALVALLVKAGRTTGPDLTDREMRTLEVYRMGLPDKEAEIEARLRLKRLK